MSGSRDVIVIGGGIIGLSIAWQLERRGTTVTVLERDECGGQASGAAAGMLAPLVESTGPGPFLDLGIASRDRYPDWAATLREETAIDIELVRSGILRVAAAADRVAQIRDRLGWLRKVAPDAVWLDDLALARAEPALRPGLPGALWLPSESHVRSAAIVAALRQALARRGAIQERQQVVAIDRRGDRIGAIRTLNETWQADQYVIAAGAWASAFSDHTTRPIPVAPIRGQILALGPKTNLLEHIVYGDGAYLVPKRGGEIVVGATEDNVGFDPRPTAGGIGRLLTAAPELVPALADVAFLRAWAGLRPATPDHLPILGRLSDDLIIAGGHYRNGVLLAPITGAVIADLVTGRQPEQDLSPFTPARFVGESVG